MFRIRECIVLIFYIAVSTSFKSYGPHPRISTENGNLIIYAAEDRNVSLVTSSRGYINLNGENLIALTKEARNAVDRVKGLTTNYLDFTTNVAHISDLVEGPEGLITRISRLENNLTLMAPSTTVRPIRIFRNRNIALNRRVTALEVKVTRMWNLLVENECNSNPCANGGQCIDIFNGFICKCPDNWEGPSCELDVNECMRFGGTDLGCQNGATCTNKLGSYECVCPAGWYGVHCTRRNQDCNSGSQQELCAHGICVSQNTGAGYECICDQGWKTDGVHLDCSVDVNECESAKPHCSVNPTVPCINVPGTYYCGSCPYGYSGTGYYCSDIDECLVSNGGCSMNPRVQCINTPGSRICGNCPPGYVGDGITCSYKGVCQVNNGGCHPLARCVENSYIGENFVQCICPSGYQGSGMGPNGCILNPNNNNNNNPCNSNPCKYGTCKYFDNNSTFACICDMDHTGPRCDILKDACSSNPCLNGGICNSTSTGYNCECTSGYTGFNCATERQACGGRLTGATGFLNYPPNNSSSYDHRVSCSWVIQTDPDQVLRITFSKFQIEHSPKCLYDWLQIHDGPNSAAHTIGRFCGSEPPNGGEITTTHNSIYIWFRSDHTVSKSGFTLKWESIDPVCGGHIEVASHGVLKSPGSPGNYPPNRDCQWILFAPEGKRLQFHFFTLMIGNNPNCSFDYLEINSGFESGHSVAKYCNTSHPEPLVTIGSVAVVNFHSDAVGSDSGFQIAYSLIEGIPGCGGVFTMDHGEISSPSHDQQYPSNMECEYKIRLTKETRIKLTFIEFDIEESSGCIFDFLEIREGGKPDSPLVGRYCGSTLPPQYTSLESELYIAFTADWTRSGGGFRIKYEAVCGGVFANPTGIIQSPGYPFSFYPRVNCIYEIKQQIGSAIKLSFSDLDIDSNTEDCLQNFLEIRDGDHENSTLIGKYCGTSRNMTDIISTHNYLWLNFKIEASDKGRKFKANYSTIDINCGGIIKDNLGVIRSPEHPKNYPPNSKCTWILSAPLGYVIQLTWITFQLEGGSKCILDYVAVYDNNTGTSEMIGKYCGKKLPPTLISSSNMLTIYFKSDMLVSLEGFILNYNVLDESKACGGRYFINTGVIRSPNYPNMYPPLKECIWVITVSPGQQIMLNVTNFELEQYINCRSDYLEIRNGAYDTSPLIGVFCGTTIPNMIPSHTNSLFLKFRSDSTKGKSGFKIYWDGATRGCGGTLNSQTGQIISPNYPQAYDRNAVCFWKIASSAGSILQIIFMDLDLEINRICGSDYVEVYDGLDTLAKSLGRYCTEKHPTFLNTTSNRALIKFRSDVSYEGRGFQIKYKTVCNTEIKGFKGVIESLNFPNNYPRNQDCTWKIIAPLGNKINITFSHFDIEENEHDEKKSCKFDYIEIKEIDEFDDTDVELLSRTCGKVLPKPMHSSRNVVHVHFVSDSLIHNAGFRLEWLVDGCGGILTHPNGVIKTPGYPKLYPMETVCEWTIRVDFDSSIQLSLGQFGFEESSDCVHDSLSIYNGEDESAPLLTKICHEDKGLQLTGTGNIMFIKFISDSSYSGTGFQATYTTVPIQCGGKYTAPSGSIHSRNYPKNYNNNDECNWLIEIEENMIIDLSFHDFDIDESTNCTEDVIKIYNGRNETAPLLFSKCGNNVSQEEIISSTRNVLYITMKTNNLSTAKGFLANYTTACGTRLVTDSTGIITFHNSIYWQCSWTIIADTPEKHVSLTITHLDVSINCDSPSLKIYDGEDVESPALGEYCGSKSPPTIVSNGPAIHIYLSYAYGADISMKYSVISTDCGGTLTSLSGTFGSIGYPNNYPMNAECEWIINLAPGNKMTLTFVEFDVIDSENCNADYVEIREKNAAGKLLGVYCGTDAPNNITQANSLWIQFRSSGVGTAKGFLAEYVLNHGNELYGNKGEIGSPLYPMMYTKTEQFSWRITVDFHSVVLIKFKDFYVSWSAYEECYLFGVKIFDGFDDTSPLLAELCLSEIPDPITSSSNVVYIQFHSSSFRYSLKFLLEWIQVQQPVVMKELSKKLPVDGCGTDSVININMLNNYKLQSPGYPFGYAGNLECEWLFSTAPESHLSIAFSKMDLEAHHPKCMMDSVSIYDGIDGKPNWKLLNTVCLTNASLMSSIHTSNMMKIVFKTDTYINKTGFAAMVVSECGGTLIGPNGVIEMSNSTMNRRDLTRMISCKWNINVKAGRTIEIKFVRFDIENVGDSNCDNYILIKNGKYEDSPFLGNGKYCGNKIPKLNLTTGNSIFIKYKAPSSSKGFKLLYKEISLSCGGHIQLSNLMSSINISSPNYPNIPPPHTECIWIISAPSGESIQVDFIERFDISYSSNCAKAGVELRDGGTMMSSLINKFCTTVPSTQRTTDNLLYVRFFTDVNDPKNGFKATVSIATCGGTYRARTGRLTSPDYPSLREYTTPTICTWKVIGIKDHYLNISFNDFKFPYSANCSRARDFLKFTEKFLMGNETTLGIFCGQKKPSNIISASNEVTITMQINTVNRAFSGFSLNFNSSRETCGGRIEAESGVITSPGYPVPSQSVRNCEWFVIVPKGRRVTVNIVDFDLSKSSYFFSQGLAFFNEKDYGSYVSYMDGAAAKTTIKSSSNQIVIYSWSSGRIYHKGFKLEFNSNEPTICQGDFNQESGIIRNPIENSTYFCQYERNLNNMSFTNRSLSLVINAPIIGNRFTANCRYQSSNIIVSTEVDSMIIAELCGKYSEPQIVRTPYPITKISISQGRNNFISNFTISYKENPCGGILTESSGNITTPNYPKKYPQPIDCAWLIKLEEGQSIKLNFIDMDMEGPCNENYIIIHNGPSPASPRIGRYCGKNLPAFIQSETSALWIDYHASSTYTGKGFWLSYEAIVAGCGGTYHDQDRFIQSPNYPALYPNNAECLWEVKAGEGYHIGLEFVNIFQIETSKNCTNDFIEVWDYQNDEWISLGRICGRDTPQKYNSTANRMKILFRTNSNITLSGFRATWHFNCGGNLIATEVPKYLISPGYPKAYTRNLKCDYVISAPKQYINIVFEDFNLESGSSLCQYDNLTIYKRRVINRGWPRMSKNLTDAYLIPISTLCGTTLPHPYRMQNELSLVFRSDKWVNRKGFKLRYFTDHCGGPITEEQQISSPVDFTGELRYHGSINCIWNITAPKDKVVIIEFTSFEFEHQRFCQYDNVELFDGTALNTTKRLALLCGNITNNLPVIRSTTNNMMIKMRTDMSNNFRGFIANVLFMYNENVGCGGIINLSNAQSTKTISSPDIDGSGQYLPNLDCHWLVVVSSDQMIEMNFESFHFAACKNVTEARKCDCDSLEVRDGGGSLSELVTYSCGHELPTKIISSGNQLWIRMITDSEYSSTGFRATLKVIQSPCGPSIVQVTNQVQYLTSPNYPLNYPNNIRCVWSLRSNNTMKRFEIHFHELNLQDANMNDQCDTDILKIYDKNALHTITSGLGQDFVFTGPKAYPTYLGIRFTQTSHIYCGSGQPTDYYSAKNEVMVSFQTDGDVTKKGFKLEYRLTGCNRNYSDSQGRIMNDAISEDCIIRISAPVNYTISIYFQSFLLTDYNNCQQSGMEIRDGNSSSANELGKLCGYLVPNPLFSFGNEVWIKVRSNRKGLGMYDLMYTTTDKGRGCGGTIVNYNGKFTSPLYPENFRNNTICRWDIMVPRGSQVTLKFLTFDLGPRNTCPSDYVELIDVNLVSGEELVRASYCGGDNPALFVATRNSMAIRYTTSVNNGGTGWVATFNAKEAMLDN